MNNNNIQTDMLDKEGLPLFDETARNMMSLL